MHQFSTGIGTRQAPALLASSSVYWVSFLTSAQQLPNFFGCEVDCRVSGLLIIDVILDGESITYRLGLRACSLGPDYNV